MPTTATEYAELIISSANEHFRTGQSDTTAEDLRAHAAVVAEAVAFLQNLQAGAKILHAPGAPDPVIGVDGDAYINELNADLYFKDATGWNFRLTLKGLPGNPGKDGKNGINGINGTNGLSAYQLAVGSGYLGSQNAWLASLNGKTPVKDVDYFDGVRGSRISFADIAPDAADALQGDLHFQTLSTTAQLQVSYFNGTAWAVQWTSPLGAAVADGSITNAKLADDIKIGSLSAAKNGFPQDAATQAQLTTAEKFFVWCGTKIQDLYTQIGQLSNLVSRFDNRITTLEQRPTGTGTGTGSGTANYPVQGTTTAGLFLQSTGTAGLEKWAAVTNNRVGWVYGFKNEVSRNQRFFKTTAITRIEKDAGISTLSYSIDGATAVNVVFTGNVFAPAANSPLSFPAGSLITWAITYNANYADAAFEVEGTEQL